MTWPKQDTAASHSFTKSAICSSIRSSTLASTRVMLGCSKISEGSLLRDLTITRTLWSLAKDFSTIGLPVCPVAPTIKMVFMTYTRQELYTDLSKLSPSKGFASCLSLPKNKIIPRRHSQQLTHLQHRLCWPLPLVHQVRLYNLHQRRACVLARG